MDHHRNGPSFDLLTDDRNSCIGCDVRNAGYHHIIVTLGQLLQFVRVPADGYDDKTGCDQLLRYHRADRARGTNNNGHFIIHCKAFSAIGIARQANALPTPKWEQRSEEHTSELPSHMRHTYSVLCLKKK